MESKKVYCLYRVSSAGQVDKDDIPMQRQACRGFATRQGWEVLNEFSEKGVSGFKVSAKDRDAIQEIQHDATLGVFDVLLVFMFDRLGRRDDETPFVVEWFVRNGIEVWSTQEGEQRFDTHVDKLMNYIRYWQASGESIKTAIRTKTRLDQLVREGCFRGGSAPYGYRLEKQGRINKKNHELFEIMVDEDAAKVVQKVFELYTRKGYGSKRICTYLTEQGIYSRAGKNFVNCTIQRILQNDAYLGILKNGEARSEIIPELQIIDEHTFELAQKINAQRSGEYAERHIPLNTRGSTLLAGNIFCGHCGARLVLSTNGKKYHRKDGGVTITPRIRYVCYNKTRHPGDCDGQTGYTSTKLDALVDELVLHIFAQVKEASRADLLLMRQNKMADECSENLVRAKATLQAANAEVHEFEAETLGVIRGTSRLDADLLNKLYSESKQKAEKQALIVKQLENELACLQQKNEMLEKEYNDLISWADMYRYCDIDEKKMILAHLFSRIEVSRDYDLDVQMTLTCEQFFELIHSEESCQEVSA